MPRTREEQQRIGIIGLATVFGFCLGGVLWGLWHDFTPEYEATHQYGPPQWVYDAESDTVRPYQEGDDYPRLVFINPETGEGMLEEEIRHLNKSRNFIIQGNMVVALTALDEEGLKVQKEQGCIACHPK